MKKALIRTEQNPYYWISYYQTLLSYYQTKPLDIEDFKVEDVKSNLAYWCERLINYKDPLYEMWKKHEDEYIAFQILKNRKWHSYWYFLRFLFTGKD